MMHQVIHNYYKPLTEFPLTVIPSLQGHILSAALFLYFYNTITILKIQLLNRKNCALPYIEI